MESAGDDILQCAICSDVFNDPRALPCLHTYCFQCISDWCSSNGKRPGSKFCCPMCRKSFEIPVDGLDKLPKNFLIANLRHQARKPSKTALKHCDVCGDTGLGSKSTAKVSAVFCLECQQTLCRTCTNHHRRIKFSESHKLVNLDNISEYSKYLTSFCDKHPNEQIKIYCVDCSASLCIMCYIKDHSSHQCSELAEAVSDFKVAMKQDMVTLSAAIGHCQDVLVNVSSRGQSFLHQAASVDTTICERAEQLKRMVDEEKATLLTDLHQMKAQNEKDLANSTQGIVEEMSMLESLKKKTSELLLKGTAADIIRERNPTHERTKELMKKIRSDLTSSSSFGEDVKFLPSKVFSPQSRVLGHVIREGSKPGVPSLKVNLPGESAVGAIALLNEEVYLTRHGQPSVLVYEAVSLRPTRQLSVPGLGWYTCGLAACGINNYVYVSDYYNSCVRRLNLEESGEPCVLSWKVGSYPAAISIAGNHNVLVTYFRMMKVREFEPDGTLVRKFSSKHYSWISVEFLEEECKVWRHGPPGGGIGAPTENITFNCYYSCAEGSGLGDSPKSWCFGVPDSVGNCLVGDQNLSRIAVFNSLLTAVRTLPLPLDVKLQVPFAVCYDEPRGRLYVGEYGGKKRLLLFDNVTCIGAMFNGKEFWV